MEGDEKRREDGFWVVVWWGGVGWGGSGSNKGELAIGVRGREGKGRAAKSLPIA